MKDAELIVCRQCHEETDADLYCHENELCFECTAPDAEELASMFALYQGEKRAGLHGEFTDEGLKMRAREMRGGN